MAIRSFRDEETRKVFDREHSRKFQSVQRVTARKLGLIEDAERLEDLAVPPGNRLEKLSGDRAGHHSIRVNDQYRICFVWEDGCADQVEITDYH